MINSSEKRNRQLAFELQNSHVCEKCSNIGKQNFRHQLGKLYTLALRTHLNIFSALVIEGTLIASDSKYKENKQYIKKKKTISKHNT